MSWMEEARNVFDELVIFIDEYRATPATIRRAEQVATRTYPHKARTWFDADFGAMARACKAEWVFLLEYDEQLSPEWHTGKWRQILGATPFTHFWVPRRWILPHGRYIAADPWSPDFQLRLFRNVDTTTFHTTLHGTISVAGRSACFRSLAIHHHVLWILSRAQREEKVRYYEQLRPVGA